MLVCNVSLRPPRRAIAADLAEAATAADATATGNVVFATLVDDPANVRDTVDAYLGEIMVEVASADAAVDAGLSFNASSIEAANATDTPSAAVATAVPTAWNPSDTTGTYTFSNGNLTVSNSNVGNVGVRSVAAQSISKFYFEVTWNSFNATGVNIGCGICTGAAAFNTLAQSAVLGAQVYASNGNIWSNNANTAISLGAVSAGQTICVAVDLINFRLWFRKNGGNWNNSGTADPATNIGGINISTVFSAAAAFASMTSNHAFNTTSNFGATAFAFTQPSGFGKLT